MRLDKTQALFAFAMLDHPDAVASPSSQLAGLFVRGDGSLPERLAIYRNNIVGSLTDAMLATYPLIKSLTGEDFANAMIRAYVLENPPHEACLARYGTGLDRFIEDFAPAKGLPYLADIARLEWAMNEAYYAQDDFPLMPKDIENVVAGNLADLSLRFRSSVHLLDSSWPLVAIRDYCLKHDEDRSEMLDLDQGGVFIMVYRPRLSVEIVSLEHAEYSFLRLLKQKTLGKSLEEIFQAYPAFGFHRFLQRHLNFETFSGLTESIEPSL